MQKILVIVIFSIFLTNLNATETDKLISNSPNDNIIRDNICNVEFQPSIFGI